jgi:hypothetical protein
MSSGANGYRCPNCGKVTMTYHVDDGVTPFYLRCRADGGCGEAMAISLGYPDGPIPDELAALPRWEWYLPDAEELAGMDEEWRVHIARGGLALRGPNGET